MSRPTVHLLIHAMLLLGVACEQIDSIETRQKSSSRPDNELVDVGDLGITAKATAGEETQVELDRALVVFSADSLNEDVDVNLKKHSLEDDDQAIIILGEPIGDAIVIQMFEPGTIDRIESSAIREAFNVSITVSDVDPLTLGFAVVYDPDSENPIYRTISQAEYSLTENADGSYTAVFPIISTHAIIYPIKIEPQKEDPGNTNSNNNGNDNGSDTGGDDDSARQSAADDVLGLTADGELWASYSNHKDTLTNRLLGKLPSGKTWSAVLACDLNDDGFTDIAALASDGKWYGGIAGGASFAISEWGGMDAGTYTSIACADFNGDGRFDVVARNATGGWIVGVSTGRKFTLSTWGAFANIEWHDIMVADVNGDGNADVVGRTESEGHWWVAVSNGTDAFQNKLWAIWDEANYDWTEVMVLDLNGDGNDDVIGRNGAGHWWANISNGKDAFSVELWGTFVAENSWTDAVALDANGDGFDDVAARDQSGHWWLGISNGSDGLTNHLWMAWSTTSTWSDVSVFDVNLDGNDDLIGRADNTGWWVGRSNGEDAMTSENWGGWANLQWTFVGVGNFVP